MCEILCLSSTFIIYRTEKLWIGVSNDYLETGVVEIVIDLSEGVQKISKNISHNIIWR